MNKWAVGEVEIYRVLEFEGPLLDPFVLLPDASDIALEEHRSWLQPTLQDPLSGKLILAFHSFVIKTPQHVILVDTCSGNHKQRPKKLRYHMKEWPYLKNLALAGFQPEEIDYVLCTHLHVDHVGWNTQLLNGAWVPTFPNAKYLFSKDEWKYWEKTYRTDTFTDDPYYEDSLLPIFEMKLDQLVNSDHKIDDWVCLEPSPGHTPGHVCVRINSGNSNAIMTGDLMHHPVQCAEPDWNSCFCVNPAQSAKTRKTFLARHAEEPTLIMPAHFPTPGAGKIVKTNGSFRFSFNEETKAS
tara:strand:+ start:482 stop:1372 length:891 start_codon:yes stop_codon:yes gene_type:complete